MYSERKDGMRFSLSEIMNLKSQVRNLTADIEMTSFSYMGDEYEFVSKAPVAIELSLESAKTVRLKARIVLTLSVPCSRCLEPVEVPFDIDVDYRYVVNEDGTAAFEDDEEPINYINGYELDVDGLVSEEVMIGFPMKVLCNEECKGICTVCGANLNRGECGCDRTVLDPRMSIIRDLFRQKEV